MGIINKARKNVEMKEPTISIIIVNYNGIEHLKNCMKSISEINYNKEKIEIIVVDNGSVDDSVKFLEQNYKNVIIIENPTNEGFAKPNNDAAKIATGEFLVMLNNDMKVDKEWLNEMIKSLRDKDESYVAVGSRILNWDGSKIDFVEAGVNYMGFGYQNFHGTPVNKIEDKYKEDRDIFAFCGGALMIDREIFLGVGGFDEDFFAYYEDSDLGWRLWILGYKITYCSKGIVYHRHNATSKKMDSLFLETLYNKNSLASCYKNFEEERIYPLLLNNILMKDYASQKSKYGLRYSPNAVSSGNASFIELISKFSEKRKFIQENRRVSDIEIFEKFDLKRYDILVNNGGKELKLLTQHNESSKAFGLTDFLPVKKPKIVIISVEAIKNKMSGPAIRYYEFARNLSDIYDVTLASSGKSEFDMTNEKFKLIDYTHTKYEDLAKAVGESEVVLLMGFTLTIPIIKDLCESKFLIIDLYDPFVLETLEIQKDLELKESLNTFYEQSFIQSELIRNGDHFICANNAQKEMWLGLIDQNSKMYDLGRKKSESYEDIISVVPFGITNIEPEKKKDLLKTKIPNLKETDTVLIWGGGVWNWFDSVTLVKAMSEICKTRDDIKLFFLGVKHPNPDVPEMEMLAKTVKIANELGITDKNVFFNYDWVDYNERENYFIDSTIGVSCHLKHLETRFSFRTRILDYLWCNLPIISTKGDHFANEVEKHDLGITVEAQNVEQLKDAIVKLTDDKEYRERCIKNISEYKEYLRWNKVVVPIRNLADKKLEKLTKGEESLNEMSTYQTLFGHRFYFKDKLKQAAWRLGLQKPTIYIRNVVKTYLIMFMMFLVFNNFIEIDIIEYGIFAGLTLPLFFYFEKTIKQFLISIGPAYTADDPFGMISDIFAVVVATGIYFLPVHILLSTSIFIYTGASLINLLWMLIAYGSVTAMIIYLMTITCYIRKIWKVTLLRVWNLVINYLIFIIPVMYSIKNIDNIFIKIIIGYNPIAFTFETYRDLVMNSTSQNIINFLLMTLFNIILAFVFQTALYKKQNKMKRKENS